LKNQAELLFKGVYLLFDSIILKKKCMRCLKGFYLKKAVIFLVIVLLPLLTFSQKEKEVDSLILLLEKNTQKDTLKVQQLLKTAYKILYNYPDEALSLSGEALELSIGLDYQAGKFKSFLFQGMCYYIKEMFSKALDMFHKALDIANKLDNNVFKSSVYGNIANIHADLGEFEKALKNYKDYLAMTQKIKNIRGQVEALTNIGVLLTEKENRIDEGIEHLNKALRLAKQEAYMHFVASINLNLGLAYKRKNNLNKALFYYDEANKLGQRLNDDNIQVLALNNISTVNMLTKHYHLAEINIKKTLKLSQKTNQIEWQASAWEGLFNLYEIKGNYLKALKAYKNNIKLNDSLKALNNKEEIIKLEEKYKYEKEKLVLKNQFEKRQLVSDQEAERQKIIKNGTLAVSGIVVVLLVIGFTFYKRKKETKFELKVANTELKALRAQMNPHFIFNALNSIGSYMSNKDTQTAKIYLGKFSSLMRQTLENSDKNQITLDEDLNLLKTYLDIEKKRFLNGFDYEINIDPELHAENVLVPPMLMQPFVENSIWHGISKLQTKGIINIEAKKEKNTLLYIVDDNGKGRKHTRNGNAPKKRSLGIKITKNRIDILNKKHNVNANLKIIDKAQGTRVEVYLPLENVFSHD
jgi:tetratricopeptide (TPR) repeat protein